MDLKKHYPQNTISHCIISNETQITLHFFQGRYPAMPEMSADLFLAILMTGMCLLTFQFFFKQFTVWFSADVGLKKVNFITFLKVS